MSIIRVAFSAITFLLISVGYVHAGADHEVHDIVQLKCGSHLVAIKCGQGDNPAVDEDRTCWDNTLIFEGDGGDQYTPLLSIPYGHDGNSFYTPTGVKCAVSTHGKHYVIVEVAACDARISMCSRIEIFDERGNHIKNRSRHYSGLLGRLLGYTMSAEEYVAGWVYIERLPPR